MFVFATELLIAGQANGDNADERCALRIDEPANCSVFLNGRQVRINEETGCITPVEIPNVPIGLYTITLAREGFNDLSISHFVDHQSQPIQARMRRGRSRLLQSSNMFPVDLRSMFPVAEQGHGERGLSKLFQSISTAAANRQLVMTIIQPGAGNEPEFVDVPVEPALLIGLRVRSGEWSPGLEVMKAVQPIFLTARGRIMGTNHGSSVGKQHEAVARPGYAVGGIVTKTGLAPDSIRLIFMKVGTKGLIHSGSYMSPWLGGNGSSGGKPRTLGVSGRPVVGICGRAPDALAGIGLIHL